MVKLLIQQLYVRHQKLLNSSKISFSLIDIFPFEHIALFFIIDKTFTMNMCNTTGVLSETATAYPSRRTGFTSSVVGRGMWFCFAHVLVFCFVFCLSLFYVLH